jgi:histidinol phosphatase-like enzyme (inositol monophosphatase family)
MIDPRLGGLDATAVEHTLMEAAAAGAAQSLPLFRTPLDVDNKWTVGFDPVTRADRDAETAIREVIARRFPDHGIVGEEWDAKPGDGPFRWIIDPIDGTRAFITGVPVWGTLVGLVHADEAVAGVMLQPFTGEMWIALPGEARYCRGAETTRLGASSVVDLAQAKLTSTSPDLFEGGSGVVQQQWDAVRARALTVRYGLDSYGYCLLASGHVDLVVEAGLKNVDIAPLIPIIENAGAVVTAWDGGPAIDGGNIVAAATPELHAQVLAVLAKSGA